MRAALKCLGALSSCAAPAVRIASSRMRGTDRHDGPAACEDRCNSTDASTIFGVTFRADTAIGSWWRCLM